MSGGKKKKQTVGYRYFMGLHMAVCHGPVDAVEALIVGDRLAWSGSVTSNAQISVSAPNLFGGEEKEGGVQGALDVLMGGPSQPVNDYLASQLGGSIPAFRGVLSLVYRGGLVSCNNPYVKKWAVKVKRVLQGWGQDGAWYPAKADVPGVGMNPAHIVYQCLTNKSWGMGYPVSIIDSSSFTAAADTLYAEGFGLNLLWNQQDAIENFVRDVCSHMNGVVYTKPDDGKFALRLIRDDYAPASLPVLGPSEIAELVSFERATWGETTNEIVVVYRDVALAADAAVAVQDIANVQMQGGVVSQTRNYPGIGQHALAARVALRDLRSVSTPLARVQLRVNRLAWTFTSGTVFKLNWPALGLAGVIFRVAKIDHGTLQDGTITIDAVEDMFGMPSSSYAASQPVGWVNPSQPPSAAPYRKLIEVPYFELATNLGDAEAGALTATEGFVQTAAVRPTGLAFDYGLRTKSSSQGAYGDRGSGAFCPSATLVSALDQFATTATYGGDIDMDLVALGTFAYLEDEVVRITALNTSAKTVTFDRGCMDTVPVAHAAGARFFFSEDFSGVDLTEWQAGEQINVKMLPRTDQGELLEASAPVDSITLNRRQNRPYGPGCLRVNSEQMPTAFACDANVSWVHRDRLSQTVSLPTFFDTASYGPEAGVTYTIKFYGETNNLLRTYSGISGASQAYTMAQEVADSGALGRPNAALRVEAFSVRGGIESWQHYNLTVDRVGYGFHFGKYWGGASGLSCSGYPTSYTYGDSSSAGSAFSVTWAPLDIGANVTLSGGNKTATKDTSAGYVSGRAQTARLTGKHYFEVRLDALPSGDAAIGVANSAESISNWLGATANSWGYWVSGNRYNSGSAISGYASFGAGDVIGVAVDLDADKMWWSKNGTWQGGGDPAAGTSPGYSNVAGDVFPAFSLYAVGCAQTIRTALSEFSGSVPSGFSAWAATVKWNSGDLSGMTLSGFDMVAAETAGVHSGVRANVGRRSGKFYFEVEVVSGAGDDWLAGLCNGSVSLASAWSSAGYRIMYRGGGSLWADGTNFSSGSGLSNGDKVCFAVDLDTRKCWMRVNGGAWIGGGDPAAGTTPTRTLGGTDALYPVAHSDNISGTTEYRLRAAEADLIHSMPSGFSAWDS